MIERRSSLSLGISTSPHVLRWLSILVFMFIAIGIYFHLFSIFFAALERLTNTIISGFSNSPLRTGATVGSLLIAVIGTYKFVLKRPSLVLEMYPSPRGINRVPIGDDANLTPVFYVKNSGIRYAENIYLEIEPITWNFDSSDVKSDPRGESLEEPAADKNKNSESTGNTVEDEYEPGLETRSLQPSDFPPQVIGPLVPAHPNSYRTKRERDHDYPNSELNIASEDVDYYIGEPGEIRKIVFEDIVYPGSEFKLFFGGATLEPLNKYELEYTIACRSVGRQKGKYIIKIFEDKIELIHHHRSLYYSIRKNAQMVIQRFAEMA